jgi:hypothetical protein
MLFDLLECESIDSLSATHEKQQPRNNAPRLPRATRTFLKRLFANCDFLSELDSRIFALTLSDDGREEEESVQFESENPQMRSAVYAICSFYGGLVVEKRSSGCMIITRSRDPQQTRNVDRPTTPLHVSLANSNNKKK